MVVHTWGWSGTGAAESDVGEVRVAADRPLLERLVEAGVLVRSGVDGVYARSAAYQEVAEGLAAMVGRWAAELLARRLHMPPVVPRATFVRTHYLESFPDLMGSVHVFRGDEREHRDLLRRVEGQGPWQELLDPAEVVLSSAVCHGVYPMYGGQVLAGSRHLEVSGYCFRHEPSLEPTRLQAFVMHEVVYLGDAEGAEAHRDAGVVRGRALLQSLGLDVAAVPAADPFFGRAGNVLASSQLADGLKVEVVTQVPGSDQPTALMSANCHRDHFGLAFDISTTDGEAAHSACVGFGIDRIVIALLATHGLRPSAWAPSIRSLLRL